jgi:glutaminyl-peptide cyclotransferase
LYSRAGNNHCFSPLIILFVFLLVSLDAMAEMSRPDHSPFFSGEQAFVWLEKQVAIGPRVPGTAGNRELRDLIVSTARSFGFGVVTDCFTAADPQSDDMIEICNVVVTVAGDKSHSASRLWLGAHFDTRPMSDQDPDPKRRGLPVLGANDGGSGVAVLIHLMELMHQRPPPTEVNLLFFDGEDSGIHGQPESYCLGSQHLAKNWQGFGSPLAGPVPRGLIVLDMIGGKNLKVPMEGYSRLNAPEWTDFVYERAASLGLKGLLAEPGRPIYDDHVPFLQAGIPAVDLIDFEYPQWHTTADLPDACSPASLAEIGTLVWDLIKTP